MATDLPTYLLYGERSGFSRAEVMHHESIASRSQLHDWEIQPHRHEWLFQILYIERGSVDARVEDRQHRLKGPALIALPPLVPHGFRFSRQVQGRVLTILDAHLQQLLAQAPTLRAALGRPVVTTLDGEATHRLALAAEAVCREQDDRGPWRLWGLDAALVQLLVAVVRAAPAAAAGPAEAVTSTGGGTTGQRALGHVQAFRELVEQRFRAQPTMQACAQALGITPTQLNRVCRQVLGHSAQAVLHARLLLEAQRELAYTTLSVKQIAFDLGFSDAGYFTRFFERESGQTPSRWRLGRQAPQGRPAHRPGG